MLASSSSATTATATVPPRLRVSRTAPPSESSMSLSTTPTQQDDSDGDTDSTSTPKPPSVAPSPSTTDATASRLKSLISRLPNNSASADLSSAPSFSRSQRETGLPSPSEHESDFEEPESPYVTTTPKAPMDHRTRLGELFRSASRDPGESPRRPQRASFGESEQGSPRMRFDELAPKSASDDDDKEKSSSMSLRFDGSASFDLLKDSIHIPGEESQHSRGGSISRELGPPLLPPSPDSPRRSSAPAASTSSSSSSSNVHRASSFETPRPWAARRSVSPTPIAAQLNQHLRRSDSPTPSSSSLASASSLFESVPRGSSRHTTPASPEREKPKPLLPEEYTTPARTSSLATLIAAERTAKAEQMQHRSSTPTSTSRVEQLQQRSSTPTSVQTPVQRTRTPTEQLQSPSTSALSPAQVPKTPKFPGAFDMTPRAGPSRPTRHHRSPSMSPADFEAADIPSSPLRGSPLADSRRANINLNLSALRTPAPPGRWVDTPKLPRSEKKVRFEDELSASATESGSENVEPDASVPVVATPTPPARHGHAAHAQSPGVRFVDEWGRERQFASDGTEIALKAMGTPTRAKAAPAKLETPSRTPKLEPPVQLAQLVEQNGKADTSTSKHRRKGSGHQSWAEIRKGLSDDDWID
ncbi:hypothetical protein EXIGLDRAFT_355155 [Exidia glandulosa HHB12029]|uniref:Uncharacterized protein n=1 Tax=Exidia glandulosa HHB12029 TaxID=1314781 RepID=A0A165CAV4_EXIGL|nr:hypothetical protein EXIGLDRAFT_355155 [Exidia glandulosa HHB12029]